MYSSKSGKLDKVHGFRLILRYKKQPNKQEMEK